MKKKIKPEESASKNHLQQKKCLTGKVEDPRGKEKRFKFRRLKKKDCCGGKFYWNKNSEV